MDGRSSAVEYFLVKASHQAQCTFGMCRRHRIHASVPFQRISILVVRVLHMLQQIRIASLALAHVRPTTDSMDALVVQPNCGVLSICMLDVGVRCWF
jgi:hypothetical protein